MYSIFLTVLTILVIFPLNHNYNNTIYYAKSGLYNNTFYYADKNGKHKITSDLSFNLFDEIGSNGEFHDIQAYGDNIYMLYQNEDGSKSFYLFSKESKTHKKLFTTKENINEWTVVDNILIFSAFFAILYISELCVKN